MNTSPVHSLGNRILVGAGEGGEYQLTGIRLSRAHGHAGEFFVGFHDGRHVGEVQAGFHAVGVHVHGDGDDVRISGSLTVSEEGAFNSVRTGQNTKLRIGHAGASVVVRVEGDTHAVPIMDVLVHVFYLIRVDVRQGHFYGCRKVQNHRMVRCRIPDVDYGVAHFQCVFRLGSGKAFRRVFKDEIGARILGRILVHELGAVDGNLLNLFL